jgi:hypothetical protein
MLRRKLLLFMVILLLPLPSVADGGFAWHALFQGQAASDAQQAVLFYFDNHETIVLQTGYKGELANFSWLIPVPSPVTIDDVSEAEGEIFSWLDQRTAPVFYTVTSYGRDSGGCGCGDDDMGVLAPGADSTYYGKADVRVLEMIVTETYEIKLLDARQAQDLIDWLDTNGYACPANAENVFDSYLSNGWFFIVVRINPSSLGEQVSETLPPLQIGFDTDQPVFPLKISTLSTSQAVEVLIHFVGDHCYRTKNVLTEKVDYPPQDINSDYVNNYYSWIKGRVEQSGGELYMLEYSNDLRSAERSLLNGYLGQDIIPDSKAYITRLRTYFSPEWFTEDVYFEPAEYDGFFKVQILVRSEEKKPFPWRLAGFVVLVPAALVRKKRKFKYARTLSYMLYLSSFLILFL